MGCVLVLGFVHDSDTNWCVFFRSSLLLGFSAFVQPTCASREFPIAPSPTPPSWGINRKCVILPVWASVLLSHRVNALTTSFIVTHFHLRPFLVHRRIFIIALFARSLRALRTGRILCSSRRGESRWCQTRWRNTRWRHAGRNARRRMSRRWREGVRGLCFLLGLAWLEGRVILAGHLGEGLALLLRVADFLRQIC